MLEQIQTHSYGSLMEQVRARMLASGPRSTRVPVGQAHCHGCGRDLLYAITAKGEHVALEPAPDGDGDAEIVNDIAKPKAGGEFAIHHCRRSRP